MEPKKSTYEAPAIRSRRRVIGLMGGGGDGDFFSCLDAGGTFEECADFPPPN
jgi:hypothetical protein